MKLVSLIKIQKNQGNMESLEETSFIMPIQPINDLLTCYRDCDLMADVFKKFGFTQPEKFFKLRDSPYLTYFKSNMALKKRFEKNPDKKYAVFYVYAGHGIQMGGRQFMVLNEFEKASNYYRLYGAEVQIRLLAEKYGNSFHLAIFACCRE